MRAFRNRGQFVDEHRALGFQLFDHRAVVDDLMADIDRRAVAAQRLLHDADRPVDAGAEAARGGQQHAAAPAARPGAWRCPAPARPSMVAVGPVGHNACPSSSELRMSDLAGARPAPVARGPESVAPRAGVQSPASANSRCWRPRAAVLAGCTARPKFAPACPQLGIVRDGGRPHPLRRHRPRHHRPRAGRPYRGGARHLPLGQQGPIGRSRRRWGSRCRLGRGPSMQGRAVNMPLSSSRCPRANRPFSTSRTSACGRILAANTDRVTLTSPEIQPADPGDARRNRRRRTRSGSASSCRARDLAYNRSRAAAGSRRGAIEGGLKSPPRSGMVAGFGYPSRESICRRPWRQVAEGATGPRKRSGKRTAREHGSLESRTGVARFAPKE